jgi:hypothetical protein
MSGRSSASRAAFLPPGSMSSNLESTLNMASILRLASSATLAADAALASPPAIFTIWAN